MTLITYSCLLYLNQHLNLRISKRLNKEVGHLEDLGSVLDLDMTGREDDDEDSLGIISSSFVILSYIANCLDNRPAILNKIMIIVKHVGALYQNMTFEKSRDKLLVCLNLLLISKFANLFGSEKLDKDQAESEGAELDMDTIKDGHKNLGVLLEFLFNVINSPDAPNSCFLFSLDVLQTIFELYSMKEDSSKTFKKNLESYIGVIYVRLLDTFDQ
jgi:hypothetical protein